jgi:hypothetical protein
MPRFEGFKNISQGIFYWLVIVAVGLVVTWLVISGIGNAVLNHQADAAKVPDIEKARYGFFISATNESVFTNSYEVSYHKTPLGQFDTVKKVYILHGYFEFNKKKYTWNKADISLDEFYFGKILVVDRLMN